MGLGLSAYNPYTLLLSLSWPRGFFAVALALYFLLNFFFALLYYALGPTALSESPNDESRLLADFFLFGEDFWHDWLRACLSGDLGR